MGQIGLLLIQLLAFADAGASSAALAQPASLQRQSTRPVAVSGAERQAIQKYRLCVLAAAKRAVASRAQRAELPLKALYACPRLRSDAQTFLIRKYGLSRKQALFDALDDRLLQEVQAPAKAKRPGRR
jgi:hypothetical protein